MEFRRVLFRSVDGGFFLVHLYFLVSQEGEFLHIVWERFQSEFGDAAFFRSLQVDDAEPSEIRNDDVPRLFVLRKRVHVICGLQESTVEVLASSFVLYEKSIRC